MESVHCILCGERFQTAPCVRLAYGSLFTCKHCQCGFLWPRPSHDRLQALHESDDYQRHPYFHGRRELTLELQRCYQSRLDLIEAVGGVVAGKTILEIGCDQGLFLEFLANQQAVTVRGVDIASRAVDAAKLSGLDVKLGALEQVGFGTATFDMVVGYDLIEHVAEPVQFLAEVKRILKPNGFAIFETPNYQGLIYMLGRTIGRFSFILGSMSGIQQRLWPPFHVQYFSKKSLWNLSDKLAMKLVRVEGKALSSEQVSIENYFLRWLVLRVFTLSRLLGKETLLSFVLQKP